jgi:hypothetical protein
MDLIPQTNWLMCYIFIGATAFGTISLSCFFKYSTTTPQLTLVSVLQKEEGAAYFKKLYDWGAEVAKNLVKAIKRGDPLADLMRIYSEVRPFYEQMEVLAVVFPDEDGELDSRPYAYPSGVFSFCLTPLSFGFLGRAVPLHLYVLTCPATF